MTVTGDTLPRSLVGAGSLLSHIICPEISSGVRGQTAPGVWFMTEGRT
jgi:hypothetical protein